MSFFKNQSDAARQFVLGLPVQSRLIVALLVVAIGIGLALLVRGEIDPGRQPMFGGRSLSEQEMVAMEMAFSSAGLNDWQREGTRILIPTDTRAEYHAALAGSTSLPTSIRSSVDEAMAAASVFDSTDMRRSRERYAREKDLAAQVMAAADIRTATVVHDRGQRRGLDRNVVQSASVVVQPVGTEPLSRRRVRMIQEMIRAAYSGMRAEDVVVTDLNGTTTASVDDDDPVLRKKREIETMVEQKIRGLLIGYPARIAASAEIDPSMNVQTTTLKYDAEPTTLASDSFKTESSQTTLPPRGEPGVRPNVTANRATSLEETTTRKSEEDRRQTRSVTGQTYENRQAASLQVRSIRVSVGLPRSFYETQLVRQALRVDPTLKPEDVDINDVAALDQLRKETQDSIRSAIAPLLPPVTGTTDPASLVQVFETPDPVEEPAAGPSGSAVALTWFNENWQTLSMLALGLVALWVARGAARAISPPPKEFEEAFGLELPTPPAEPPVVTEEADMDITGSDLQGELSRIVDSNPEVAANVIRSWIGEAA